MKEVFEIKDWKILLKRWNKINHRKCMTESVSYERISSILSIYDLWIHEVQIFRQIFNCFLWKFDWFNWTLLVIMGTLKFYNFEYLLPVYKMEIMIKLNCNKAIISMLKRISITSLIWYLTLFLYNIVIFLFFNLHKWILMCQDYLYVSLKYLVCYK